MLRFWGSGDGSNVCRDDCRGAFLTQNCTEINPAAVREAKLIKGLTCKTSISLKKGYFFFQNFNTFKNNFALLSLSGELVPIRLVTSLLLVSVEAMKLLQHNCVTVR